jgi:hypothetical protein
MHVVDRRLIERFVRGGTCPRRMPSACVSRVALVWPQAPLRRYSAQSHGLRAEVGVSEVLVVSSPFGRGHDLEAEHHPALDVLGDVAVGHPKAGIGDVE